MVRLLEDARPVIDRSIMNNLRDDHLYHAYNLLDQDGASAGISHLYPMLEGQVAVLSAGLLAPAEVISVLEALFASDMYREDQRSFMLYPDRQLPGFLNKNRVSAELIESVPLLLKMIREGDQGIVLLDVDGNYRFNADITNVVDLNEMLAGGLAQGPAGVKVDFRGQAGLWRVRGEWERLVDSFDELARNAAEAMGGQGVVKVRTANVRIEGDPGGLPDGAYIEVRIEDTGPGMDDAQRDRALEPLGFAPEQRPFRPHVTLARASSTAARRQVVDLVGDDRNQRHRFEVADVSLFARDDTGAGRYREIERLLLALPERR